MSFSISASGLAAQRIRMNVIANNLANVNTTRTPEGGPYRRRSVLFESVEGQGGFSGLLSNEISSRGGVRVSQIIEDTSESAFTEKMDPTHPDADPVTGIVKMPNINPITEMVNLLSATRAFEANVTAFNSTKDLYRKSLEIGAGA
jgi:flagellar basal-body rod protein FlgC